VSELEDRELNTAGVSLIHPVADGRHRLDDETHDN
jgi:hypothetical protein